MKINSSNKQSKIISLPKKLVSIVIPIYKDKLSPSENISLNRCKIILKKYPKILIAPINIDINEYLKIDNKLKVIRFDEIFFKGFEGYNRLMLSRLFYENFIEYDYILIHQLDAFIFKDVLTNWCDKNYDYIGAPWYRDSVKIFVNVAKKNSLLRAIKLISTKSLNYRPGNGGLSLRKVQSFLECLDLEQKFISNWKRLNEDIFWSFFSHTNKEEFNIPDFRTAIKFAIEKKPRKAFKLNNYELPFGVHAWEKWDEEFWRPYIKKFSNSFDNSLPLD